MRTVHTLAVTIASALLLAAGAAAEVSNDFLLVLDQRAGPYRYLTSFEPDASQRSYPAALAAFGSPSSRQAIFNYCRVTWAEAGIEVDFVSLLDHPCSAANLRRSAWYGMSLTGRRWHNRRGIRVGEPMTEVRRVYPHARFETVAGERWLVLARRRVSEFDFILLAVTVDPFGRVRSIEVPPAYVF